MHIARRGCSSAWICVGVGSGGVESWGAGGILMVGTHSAMDCSSGGPVGTGVVELRYVGVLG